MPYPIERDHLTRSINYQDIDHLVSLVQEAYDPKSDVEKTEQNLSKSDIGVSKLVRHQLENNQQILDTTHQIIHATEYPLQTLDSQVKSIMRLNRLELVSAQAIPEMEQSVPLDALTRSFLLALRTATSFTTLASKLYPIYNRHHIISDARQELNTKKERLTANPNDGALKAEIKELEELIVHESEEQATDLKRFFENLALDMPSIAEKGLLTLELMKIPAGQILNYTTPVLFISGAIDLFKEAREVYKTHHNIKDLEKWIAATSLSNRTVDLTKKGSFNSQVGNLFEEKLTPMHRLGMKYENMLNEILSANSDQPLETLIKDLNSRGIDLLLILAKRKLAGLKAFPQQDFTMVCSESLKELETNIDDYLADAGIKLEMQMQLARSRQPKKVTQIEHEESLAVTTKNALKTLEQKKLDIEIQQLRRDLRHTMISLTAHSLQLGGLLAIALTLGLANPLIGIPILASLAITGTLMIHDLHQLKKNHGNLYKGWTFNSALHLSLLWNKWKLFRKDSELSSQMKALRKIVSYCLTNIAEYKKLQEAALKLANNEKIEGNSRSIKKVLALPEEERPRKIEELLRSKREKIDHYMAKYIRREHEGLNETAEKIRDLVDQRKVIEEKLSLQSKEIQEAKWKDFIKATRINENSNVMLAVALKELRGCKRIAQSKQMEEIDSILKQMGIDPEKESSMIDALKRYYLMDQAEMMKLVRA